MSRPLASGGSEDYGGDGQRRSVMTLAVRHQKFSIVHMITGVALIPTAVLGLLFFVEKLIYR
jgi:hypothetical protein